MDRLTWPWQHICEAISCASKAQLHNMRQIFPDVIFLCSLLDRLHPASHCMATPLWSSANVAFLHNRFPFFLPHRMHRNRRAIFETLDQPTYLDSREMAFHIGVVCLSHLVLSHSACAESVHLLSFPARFLWHGVCGAVRISEEFPEFGPYL